MKYSKPQITIDLEEYNELLKTKDYSASDNKDNEALAILVKIIYNEPRIMNNFIDVLNRFKIHMTVDNQLSTGLPKVITKERI